MNVETIPKINILGRCKLDSDAILREMPEIIAAESHSGYDDGAFKKIWAAVYDTYRALPKEDAKILEQAYNHTYKDHGWSGYFTTHTKEEILEKTKEGFFRDFEEDLKASEALNVSFKCLLQIGDYSLIFLSGEDSYWLFPSHFIEVEKYKDYNALSGSERLAAISGSHIDPDNAPVASSLTYTDAISQKENVSAAIESVEADMKSVNEAKAEGLASLQAEIDRLTQELEAKKRSMLDELEVKKAEMQVKLEEMENTVFKLDAEIYAIRCYTGEIVEVNQIRSGKAGKADTPIVFYQKMRYLDEELGRIASLYNVDFGSEKYFESILANRDDVIDAFLPAERSIALVRVSKTNKGYYNTEFPGILETYEKYHGRKVAILIRDGENLYLTWTDDDRIYFSEDAFLKPMSRVAEKSEAAALMKGKYESDKDYEKRMKDLQKTAVKESLGRYYVFTLLQGMLDRGLIKLPEKVKLTDSKYVIFSMADGWLDDNRYGTLEEMIKRSNASVKKGDYILMTSSLWAYSKEHKNDRGRGYSDRTWDVRAKDKEIYPVNLTEHIAQYSYTYMSDDGPKTNNTGWRISDEEYRQKFVESYYADRYTDVEMIPGTEGYRYYLSLLKTASLSGSARANFEVYKDEFINLTFLNSVWLKYVLRGSKSGSVKIGGCSVDFAHVIPYIKKALAFIENRESETLAQIIKIDPAISEDEEWPVKMSEWMLENDIHNFSEFRTKQFVKHLKEAKC